MVIVRYPNNALFEPKTHTGYKSELSNKICIHMMKALRSEYRITLYVQFIDGMSQFYASVKRMYTFEYRTKFLCSVSKWLQQI